jgi:hypothetical protein
MSGRVTRRPRLVLLAAVRFERGGQLLCLRLMARRPGGLDGRDATQIVPFTSAHA